MTIQRRLPKNDKTRQEPKCDMSKWYKFFIWPLYVKDIPTEELHTSAADRIPTKEFKNGMAWIYAKNERGSGYHPYGTVRFGTLEVTV